MATLAWVWLVKWRVGRHRAAIWKSLILPAGGAALCWLLAMTLWLPLLDFARSYTVLVRRATSELGQASCVEEQGLSRSQIAAFQFHGHLVMKPAGSPSKCPWLIVDKDAADTLSSIVDLTHWTLHSTLHHPSDRDESVLIYKRTTEPGS
jgi:4-amino-4-deoxy-L-arabinose transferase-like glycosyltransferase